MIGTLTLPMCMCMCALLNSRVIRKQGREVDTVSVQWNTPLSSATARESSGQCCAPGARARGGAGPGTSSALAALVGVRGEVGRVFR